MDVLEALGDRRYPIVADLQLGKDVGAVRAGSSGSHYARIYIGRGYLRTRDCRTARVSRYATNLRIDVVGSRRDRYQSHDQPQHE